jgi:hypothetical protein
MGKLEEKFQLVKNILDKSANGPKMYDMGMLYYSSFLFLIPLFYCIINKLYLNSILIFYLFITSITFWSDYNNKFKLSCDHFLIGSIGICFYVSCYKVKSYMLAFNFTILLGILYVYSAYFKIKYNYLNSSNIWIGAHMLVSITLLLISHKLVLHKNKLKK